MSNPPKKTSANLKSKQKRKDPEDTTDKVTQSKPNKKARKDDAQPQTERSKITTTKPTPKTTIGAAKAVSKKNETKKLSGNKPLAKPSNKTKKTVKVVPLPEEDSESQEESSDVESEVIQVKDVVEEEDDDNDDEKDKENEEDDHLVGFSSEEDSSDEELDQNEDSVDISKLPSIVKGDAELKKRLDNAKAKQSEERGVIYLGRIPHGLYEDEMRGYFAQFGDVTRIRLSRNKKTGRSKHYAFIEFTSAEVAQIVSETMNNYLLMGHILQCRVIPKDEVHPELWVGANRKWRYVPHDRLVRVKHNKIRTPEEQERAEKKLIARQIEKQKKIKDKGIDYDIEPVGYRLPVEASA